MTDRPKCCECGADYYANEECDRFEFVDALSGEVARYCADCWVEEKASAGETYLSQNRSLVCVEIAGRIESAREAAADGDHERADELMASSVQALRIAAQDAR